MRAAASRAVVVAAGILLAACGDKSPTAPSRLTPTTSTRVWMGTLTDERNGAGTLHVAGSGSGPALIGTWTAQFPGGTQSGRALINLASLSNGTAGFILDPETRPTCNDPLLGSLAGSFLLQLSGTEAALSGPSIYYDCGRIFMGRADLTRQ